MRTTRSLPREDGHLSSNSKTDESSPQRALRGRTVTRLKQQPPRAAAAHLQALQEDRDDANRLSTWCVGFNICVSGAFLAIFTLYMRLSVQFSELQSRCPRQ